MQQQGSVRSRCPAPPISPVRLRFFSTVSLLLLSATSVSGWRPTPSPTHRPKKYSNEPVHLKYHMGPLLTNNITLHTIWYGQWLKSQKHIIRSFLNSISAVNVKHPSVADWWKTVQLYTDQTGANISSNVRFGEEKNDRYYSHGKSLTRLSIQSIINAAVKARTRPLPINPKNGLYLVFTSSDVLVEDFCSQICGFHYYTFPSIVGYTLPFAWVGNSATQCPGLCAYPFVVPPYIRNLKPVRPPNGEVGVDGMISVIGHEIAELATNPFRNGWYVGKDPYNFPMEIADLCEGIYGRGGGGYNMHGLGGRRFLVQWVWNLILNCCSGTNAVHQ